MFLAILRVAHTHTLSHPRLSMCARSMLLCQCYIAKAGASACPLPNCFALPSGRVSGVGNDLALGTCPQIELLLFLLNSIVIFCCCCSSCCCRLHCVSGIRRARAAFTQRAVRFCGYSMRIFLCTHIFCVMPVKLVCLKSD